MHDSLSHPVAFFIKPKSRIAGFGSNTLVQRISLNLRSVSGIGGIGTWQDAVEHMRPGASNVQVCTAVMHCGFRIVKEMTAGPGEYMCDKGMQSLDDLVGRSLQTINHWDKLNLHYKVVAEIIEENCVSCNLCSYVCPVEECITMMRRDDVTKVESWKDFVVADKASVSFEDQRSGGVRHHICRPVEAL